MRFWKQMRTEWKRWDSYAVKFHDDVIKWQHFPRHWPFVWEIHRSPVNSPHKGQWRQALMFSFICAWINGCVNNKEASNLIRHRANYNAIVKWWSIAVLLFVRIKQIPEFMRLYTETGSNRPCWISQMQMNEILDVGSKCLIFCAYFGIMK